MKKIFTLAMIMMAMTITANAMSYKAAKNEALFLSDKMAYELNLTDAQYDAIYEINLDYLMCVDGRNDVFGPWWDRRNADLRFVLTPRQYDRYVALNYFYRPISWHNGGLTFHIYSRYTNRSHFYKARPTVYASYRGGHRSTYGRLQGKSKVHGSHYAHMHKPAPAPAKVRHDAHGAPNREIAHHPAPKDAHHDHAGFGHFGGRR